MDKTAFTNLGEIFTRSEVVEGMLDLLEYKCNHDLSHIRVLEPSSGNGAFAIKIVQRLIESSKIHHFSIEKALDNITFCEIDHIKSEILEKAIKTEFVKNNIEKEPSDLIRSEDFLLSELAKFDLIIGNPPYVRWEHIPIQMRETYKKSFRTFFDRCDLYIPFFEKGLNYLAPGGKLSFICSNRWFKTKYGKKLRDLISACFKVEFIIDMEKIDAFQRKVTAYPSIITIANNLKIGDPVFYKSKNLKDFKQMCSDGIHMIPEVKILSEHNIWLNSLDNKISNNSSLELIESQGFKIGIGVATGRDKVFIGENLNEYVEAELLVPIITAKELKANEYRPSKKWVINPFNERGQLINLRNYPKAATYLAMFRDELVKRHIAKKNPDDWYRTIDKINPEIVKENKILLPDITGNKKIFIDEGTYYPHHNLYYITGNSLNDLKVLASILMSDFIHEQLVVLSSNMNGGYPRWQSQNLRRLRIPVISLLKPEFYNDLLRAYDKQDLMKINQLVSLKGIEGNIDLAQRWTLFEPLN
ncbi:MAG: Eco57I restriction-modification methylase domain-containing protein [Bacteroidota bacterium]